MPTQEPKMRSITGKLVANRLTAREDDYTCNIVYQANRSIKDLCKLAEAKSKFTAAELENAYSDLRNTAREELFNASTVEFGFSINSLGIEGSFIGPKAQFSSDKNRVVIRSTTLAEYRKDLDKINVIISSTEESLPTITTITDVTTGSVNNRITAGGGLNGTGSRVKIAGDMEAEIGFYFVSAKDDTKTKVPATSILRNEPSSFTLIIPALANGSYYLEIATQYGGNSKQLLKDVRRNRFPYLLYVGEKPEESGGDGDHSNI